eukprot:Gb_23284 [translate_table: standard]
MNGRHRCSLPRCISRSRNWGRRSIDTNIRVNFLTNRRSLTLRWSGYAFI